MLLPTAVFFLFFFLVLVTEAIDLPLLELPYGTWQAAKYDDVAKVYTYKNVRYGAPPTGNLRFARPQPPGVVEGIQDGSGGALCMQFHNPVASLPPRNDSNGPDYARIIQESLSRQKYSEDCLFLDLYIPEEALQPNQNLPVIVYVHGGAYTSGSKDFLDVIGLYDGTGLVKQSKGRAIVVTMNYRLGVFGWLGGTSAEIAGATNLGLLDQRLAFKWLQDYIHLVGGDPENVTALGESAGGGSLMHHLVLEGGTLPPLFHRAQFYSPGLIYNFDRKGKLEKAFKKFATVAGCQDHGFSCLRAASPEDLLRGQVAVAGTSFTAATPQFGPVPDGKLIRNAVSLEMAAGNYWNNLDSLIVSHAKDDIGPFVNQSIKTDAAFLSFLLDAFDYDDIVASIASEYPSEDYSSPLARQADVTKDAIFACNYRWVTDAFPSQSYNMQFSGGSSGSHGQVLPAVFYNPTLTMEDNGSLYPVTGYFGNRSIYKSLQSYIVSHAVSGSPNTHRECSTTIAWPQVADVESENLGRVLNVTNDGFELISDAQGSSSRCDFWLSLHADLANKAKQLRCP